MLGWGWKPLQYFWDLLLMWDPCGRHTSRHMDHHRQLRTPLPKCQKWLEQLGGLFYLRKHHMKRQRHGYFCTCHPRHEDQLRLEREHIVHCTLDQPKAFPHRWVVVRPKMVATSRVLRSTIVMDSVGMTGVAFGTCGWTTTRG